MSPTKPVTIHARRGFVALAAVAFFALPSGAWVLSSSLTETEDRTEEIAGLARRIQAQRTETIGRNCRDQNMRHDRTVQALDLLIAQAPADRRARAEQSRAGTLLLIEALAPRQDCAVVVQRATTTP